MNIVCIVQARTTSRRLPGKVLLPLEGEPMIGYQLKRLGYCKSLTNVVVATSTDSTDDALAGILKDKGVSVFRGPLEDVLERYSLCAEMFKADAIVRVTGDCPFSDPVLVDDMVQRFVSTNVQYISNSADEKSLTVPDGFDIEVFSREALERARRYSRVSSEREHVTSWIRRADSKIAWGHVNQRASKTDLRLTVDTPEDYVVACRVAQELGKKQIPFGVEDIITFLETNLSIRSINAKNKRNEGYEASIENEARFGEDTGRGQRLWERAKLAIPGGNMLLSKRPDMFLPGRWPAYFDSAKGCIVKDLDGRSYVDFSIMGIGTNILGYGDEEVDRAVRDVVTKGNMSTLNCPEEVLLAERLVQIHPWAEMVRFARTGGEANAIAIRIARAASGKDKVAICGYHGWHDWYLAANLADEENLDGHLLPGLEPNGVPRSLKGSVVPFRYNDYNGLKEIVEQGDVGCIKMEVQRSEEPKNDFLAKVRALADKNGIVLVFDECTSGFRQTFGGLHKLYGVDPDMAMFGKALGNGYGITATIGRRSVMEAAQSTFISSTFWTERIGPVAALKTLDVMERECAWEKITSFGGRIKTVWGDLSCKHGIEMVQSGIPALCCFSVGKKNQLAYKTLITQEMLKRGILAGNSVYVSLAHTEEILERYASELDGIFGLIRECEDGRDVMELIDGDVCHSGFQRLN